MGVGPVAVDLLDLLVVKRPVDHGVQSDVTAPTTRRRGRRGLSTSGP